MELLLLNCPKTEEDFYAFIHPDDRELVSKQLELLFKYKQPVKWDSRFVLKDNQVRYVMNQCIIKVDKSGEPIEVVGTIADITDRKIAEIEILKMNQLLEERVAQRTKELVVLNQDKDEILSITAHDLRNPLGGILLQSSLVKLYYEKGQLEQANTYILDIEKSVHRMNEIITNLLNSHALEIGKYNFEFNEYDCSEVVRITVDTFESQANHKGIHITQIIQLFQLHIDKDAFREVLENLLSNAVKYSPLNKNITVNLSFTPAGKLRVEVQDKGPGISVEDQKRLFGKFVRLSAKPTGGESSSGLGLSIAKSIVEQMHGSIWCESIEGVGSTFFVEFPVHSPISQ
ncbi:MAG: PAS domain-containing sensor histidine kinase [Ignavibacteria bacterium]|nr:PAS domain-containing sensor histidine kinase [Ignavibacteria bacterium]